MSSEVVQNLACDNEQEVIETDSLCTNCFKTGTTRLFITRIAYFRDIVISSFHCPHCNFENCLIDPSSPIPSQGKLFKLDVRCAKDLNRRIVQPNHSEICIPSLDSTFPCSEGCLTTIEGAIRNIIDNISYLQDERKKQNPKQAELLDAFIEKLNKLLNIEETFILVLNDPSGTGFIENLRAPLSDPQLTCTKFNRTIEQSQSLGFSADQVTEEKEEEEEAHEALTNSVSILNVECSNCHSDCETKIKIVDIPHFKEVILMAVHCEHCGFRNNEVKSFSGIAEKGKTYRLLIEKEEDLSRDVLKSDCATINFPELEIESLSGTLGSCFTTVEGLIANVRDQLTGMNPFLFGDSADSSSKKEKVVLLCDKLTEIICGKRTNVHLEITDPTGNSYVQSFSDNGLDSRLQELEFERTFEQNEELGLNDMCTENYM